MTSALIEAIAVTEAQREKMSDISKAVAALSEHPAATIALLKAYAAEFCAYSLAWQDIERRADYHYDSRRAAFAAFDAETRHSHHNRVVFINKE